MHKTIYRLLRMLRNKRTMYRLSSDLSTFIKLHTLGWRPRNRSSEPRSAGAVPLHLRTVPSGPVLCRPGTSDLAVLWEVFAEEQYRLPDQLVGDVRTVVDLGANVGYSMIYFAIRYPRAQVLGVEPDHENVEMIRKNMASIGLENRCQVIQAAVWHRNTMVELDRSGPAYAFQVSREQPDSLSAVRACTLLTLLDETNIPHVDLLKVDIEGAEETLFNTAASWADRVGSIIAELHGSYEIAQIRNALAPHGFYCLEPGNATGLALPLAVRTIGWFDRAASAMHTSAS